MSDQISRREALKVIGLTGAAALVPHAADAATTISDTAAISAKPILAPAEILPLTSTSDVFIPPRGNSFFKFSFDFPEPSIAFDGLRFGVIVFTHENAYALDPSRTTATTTPSGLRVSCNGLTWGGGQEKANGRVTLDLRKVNDAVEWSIDVECEHPIKSVTTVVRDIPRGRVSFGGGDFFDPKDDEILFGYPFSGGDLFGPGGAGGMTTPLAIFEKSAGDYVYISSLDDRVRTKRFFLQPGEHGYRVEAGWEADGWTHQRRATVPTWRLGRVATPDASLTRHYDHLRRAYKLPDFSSRTDVPAWMHDVALVTTLHGQHYTGYIFNDYARMLEIMRWMATQMPPERALIFLSPWDGRYYWDYPNYQVDPRMGGERGFATLVREGRKLGFRIMPMFGANSANRRQPVWPRIANAATEKVDGDPMSLNWVDWDNDRHQEGWLAYMNLGVASWRDWLGGRISDIITRFDVDAYFLDIIGGWTNNPQADMHEGARKLVARLRAAHPSVACVGEMHYDALLEFIPMYHAGGGGMGRPFVQRHAKFFSHLSAPAPGRGSSGVHESGFGNFNTETLGLNPNAIPTLQVVDDTFAKHRDTMAAVIKVAKARAGIA
ncbi:MAG: hypothetical protein ABIT38_17900 [Gemmatimonadaceae bacterium]